MKRLCINIDHIATLREARGVIEPDPAHSVAICEMAGASGIVCHLREDRRHINDRDLRLLREIINTKLDLEMAATEEMKKIALETLPELITLVPEKRQELTTEGGLDVIKQKEFLKAYVPVFQDKGIDVSLFIDPIKDQIDAAAELGVNFIEIHTGEYANARGHNEVEHQIKRIRTAAEHASKLGLKVNAGHGVNYQNAHQLLAIKEIEEMSIGHSILSRAVFVGLERAVKDMVEIFNRY